MVALTDAFCRDHLTGRTAIESVLTGGPRAVKSPRPTAVPKHMRMLAHRTAGGESSTLSRLTILTGGRVMVVGLVR